VVLPRVPQLHLELRRGVEHQPQRDAPGPDVGGEPRPSRVRRVGSEAVRSPCTGVSPLGGWKNGYANRLDAMSSSPGTDGWRPRGIRTRGGFASDHGLATGDAMPM
jgi:hypothetical protein